LLDKNFNEFSGVSHSYQNANISICHQRYTDVWKFNRIEGGHEMLVNGQFSLGQYQTFEQWKTGRILNRVLWQSRCSARQISAT